MYNMNFLFCIGHLLVLYFIYDEIHGMHLIYNIIRPRSCYNLLFTPAIISLITQQTRARAIK